MANLDMHALGELTAKFVDDSRLSADPVDPSFTHVINETEGFLIDLLSLSAAATPALVHDLSSGQASASTLAALSHIYELMSRALRHLTENANERAPAPHTNDPHPDSRATLDTLVAVTTSLPGRSDATSGRPGLIVPSGVRVHDKA